MSQLRPSPYSDGGDYKAAERDFLHLMITLCITLTFEDNHRAINLVRQLSLPAPCVIFLSNQFWHGIM